MKGFFLLLIGIVALDLPAFSDTNTLIRKDASRVIRISKETFEVELPAGWSESKESQPETLVFTDSTGKEQLTVSLFFLKKSLTKDEIIDTVKRIVEVRRKTEQDQSSGKTKLSDYKIVDRDGAIFTNFVGYEEPRDRRLTNLVTAENSKLISFYLESISTSDKAHNSLADAIFRSIVVK